MQNSMGGCRIQDAGTCGKHQAEKIPGGPAGGVGCRIQDPGSVATGGGKQPTFRTTHGAPPNATHVGKITAFIVFIFMRENRPFFSDPVLKSAWYGQK